MLLGTCAVFSLLTWPVGHEDPCLTLPYLGHQLAGENTGVEPESLCHSHGQRHRAGTRTQAPSLPGADHLAKGCRGRCCLSCGRPFCLLSPSYALVPTPTEAALPAFCQLSARLSLAHPFVCLTSTRQGPAARHGLKFHISLVRQCGDV